MDDVQGYRLRWVKSDGSKAQSPVLSFTAALRRLIELDDDVSVERVDLIADKTDRFDRNLGDLADFLTAGG